MNTGNRGEAKPHQRPTFLPTRLLWLLPALLILFVATPAAAQTTSAAYWQYDAAGRLDFSIVADVDNDGVDEFLLAVEGGGIVLLAADGRERWNYAAETPVLQLAALNPNGPNRPGAVVAATANHLSLLSADGQLLWQRPIEAPPGAPPAPVVLLTGEDEAAWQSQRAASPAALAIIDPRGDGRDEIVVALKSGLLQLFDAQGVLQWQYPEREDYPDDAQPKVVVDDINLDGLPDIAYAYFLPRGDNQGGLSKLAFLSGDGERRWERTVPGRLTAMTRIQFDPQSAAEIAVSTRSSRRNQIFVYDIQGLSRWMRTPNRPVTSLIAATLGERQALVAGTDVATLIAWDGDGRRLWQRLYSFSGEPDRRIARLVAAPPTDRATSISLAVTLAGLADEATEPTDILLLDANGCSVRSTAAISTLPLGEGCLVNPSVYPPIPSTGEAALTDINDDGQSELLLSRFGTLELLDPGIGVPQYRASDSWGGYRLETRPVAMMVTDLDRDGQNELLIGGGDGRVHVVTRDGTARWTVDVGGAIRRLALLAQSSPDVPPAIAVVHDLDAGSGSQLDLLAADGRRLWANSILLESAVTELLVTNADGTGRPEIVIATTDGSVFIYSVAGTLLSTTTIPARITHLAALETPPTGGLPEIYAVSASDALYRFNIGDEFPRDAATFFTAPVHALYVIEEGRELATHILIVLENGVVHGLNWRGIALWQTQLNAEPVTILPDERRFYIATSEGTLTTLDVIESNPFISAEVSGQRGPELVVDEERPLPRLTGLGTVRTLYRGHLERDTTLDMAVGNEEGEVILFSGDGRALGRLSLNTGIFGITALRSEVLQTDDLLVVADNGIIQLFQARENRPPLLINPRTIIDSSRYDIAVTVLDTESNSVAVTLELWDPTVSRWLPQETKVAGGGEATVTWLADVTGIDGPVHYRFAYDDGSHQGIVEPTAGLPPVPPETVISSGELLAVGLLLVAMVGGIFLSQSQSSSLRARRLYRRLQSQPADTLRSLADEYARTDGAPELLLTLANLARRRDNRPLAGLADGLFLLEDRPAVALPIITGALEEVEESEAAWDDTVSWHRKFELMSSLFDAPSITELTLLRPRLVELRDELAAAERPFEHGDPLLAIVNALRDSERVDMAEDRFVYLHEAGVLTRQLRERLQLSAGTIDNRLTSAVLLRWLGLINAAVDELRGQAQLVVNLKTHRLVPGPTTTVALEIQNVGRSAAEHVIVAVDADPAYEVVSGPQSIPFLSPGRARQVHLVIIPRVEDRFRLACTITFDDHHESDHQLAFADMVHLLPPVRDFKPVINPYSPGVPLRENSRLFYGREELFDFIAASASQLARQNVLILIGQRRTGKTSALLRLRHHLPPQMVPVYIDCQSLGVLPGMAPFFHDLAWLIADALDDQDISIDVPPPETWQSDPARRFQRHFIPEVRGLLPEGATLLLVFDEFEAFENLVSDGILPPTLFTFLRHMMQHGDGLSFVFVGTRRLEEMTADYWSVLFNIALYRHIGFLDKPAAIRLITNPVEPNIIYDDLAIDKIWRVTAGHPYFLQLVCYALVNRANRQKTGYVTISDVNAALTEMLRLGEVHFAYIWKRSTPAERALLNAIAHLMESESPFRPAALVQYLAKYGVHLDPAAVTGGLNRLVEREIMREVHDGPTTLYEMKIGLVGLWVAQNKSLSQLHEPRNGATQPMRLLRPSQSDR